MFPDSRSSWKHFLLMVVFPCKKSVRFLWSSSQLARRGAQGRASQLSTFPLWGVDWCAGRHSGGELRPFCLSGNCGRCSIGCISSVGCTHLSDTVVSLGIKTLSWVRPAANDQWLRPFSDAHLALVNDVPWRFSVHPVRSSSLVVVYGTLCVAHHNIGWEVACSVD